MYVGKTCNLQSCYHFSSFGNIFLVLLRSAPLSTVHCPLSTVHCPLSTVHYLLYTVNCFVHIPNLGGFPVNAPTCSSGFFFQGGPSCSNVYCPLSTVHCQLSTVHCSYTQFGRFSCYCSDLLLWIFSKHRPTGPMLSISRNIRLCVCPSVCVSVCVSVHF